MKKTILVLAAISFASSARAEDMVSPSNAKSDEQKAAHLHYDNGAALQDKGELQAAVAEFKLAVASDKSLAEAHEKLGVIYQRQQDLYSKSLQTRLADEMKQQALEELKVAAQLMPENAIYLCRYAVALHSVGRRADAIKYYRRAIKFDPSFSEAYSGLYQALTFLGRGTEAKEILKRELSTPIELKLQLQGDGGPRLY
jgi:tetratricopeptide (TPR) repeat protein